MRRGGPCGPFGLRGVAVRQRQQVAAFGGASMREARPEQWSSALFILRLSSDDDGHREPEARRVGEGGQ
eukprot:1018269-Alexandrium_andersonii.AAC.1